MSRASRQRGREAALLTKRRSHRKLLAWVLPSVIVLSIVGVFAWQNTKRNQVAHSNGSLQTAGFRFPTTFIELCALNTNDVEKCDIALMNLLCAEGLRGAENSLLSGY